MHVDENTSLLDLVVLIVLAEGMNVWIGAENPFTGMQDLDTLDKLRRFEFMASALTIVFGFAASLLSKRSSPVVFAIVLALGMTWLYEYEWSREHVGEVEA